MLYLELSKGQNGQGVQAISITLPGRNQVLLDRSFRCALQNTLLWSGHICTSFRDWATWAELRSAMAVELQPAHPVAVRLLSSNFGNSEQGLQLCQADACVVLDGYDEWGSMAAALWLDLISFCFPPSKEQLKFSSAYACYRIKSCKGTASVARTDLRHGVHLECSLLQILTVLWVNLHNIQWVFSKQNNSENNWNGSEWHWSLCSNYLFLKIHGEPLKYEFVFLPLCYHLGDIRSVCQRSSCIVQVFQGLLPGLAGCNFWNNTYGIAWKK